MGALCAVLNLKRNQEINDRASSKKKNISDIYSGLVQ